MLYGFYSSSIISIYLSIIKSIAINIYWLCNNEKKRFAIQSKVIIIINISTKYKVTFTHVTEFYLSHHFHINKKKVKYTVTKSYDLV